MTIRSLRAESAAIIARGLAFSRVLRQVRTLGAPAPCVEAPILGRVWALKETKKSRGWLIGAALVALAFVVSLILA